MKTRIIVAIVATATMLLFACGDNGGASALTGTPANAGLATKSAMNRTIVQVAGLGYQDGPYDAVFAVCADGTLWYGVLTSTGTKWSNIVGLADIVHVSSQGYKDDQYHNIVYVVCADGTAWRGVIDPSGTIWEEIDGISEWHNPEPPIE